MRIAVLGDFHLRAKEYDLTKAAMQDIEDCQPDLVVPLGDFGSNSTIGSVDGLHEAKSFLDLIGAPMRPILGNHDLQRETGEGKQSKGIMALELKRLFDLDSPYGTLEFDDFRLFFASTEPQPPDSCYSIQECYNTDEQFEHLVRKLKERRGVPVIFFTHAPPIACGLRTVPTVHVRSTNAYLDQNHNPYRWQQLYREYPEIIAWFSAHYHLGHHYIDSHCTRSGTHFFHTGVHGSCTRDGQRLSRIVDITGHGIHVQTLDHQSRKLTNCGEYRFDGPLSQLCTGANSKEPTDHLSGYQKSDEVSVGEALTATDKLIPVDGNRFICATEDGFSWEVVPETEAVMGTLHIGPALRSIDVSGEYLWMAWGNFIGRTSLNDPWRFVRIPTGAWPYEAFELPGEPACLAASSHGGVWFSIANSIFRMDQNADYELAFTLPYKPRKLIESLDGLFILDEQENLWVSSVTVQAGNPELQGSGIAAFDTIDDQIVTARKNDLLELCWAQGDGATRTVSFEEPAEVHTLQTRCLKDKKVLLNINGTAYLWDVPKEEVLPVPGENGKVTCISRVHPSGGIAGDGFAVSRDSDNAFMRPRLEIWRSF